MNKHQSQQKKITKSLNDRRKRKKKKKKEKTQNRPGAS